MFLLDESREQVPLQKLQGRDIENICAGRADVARGNARCVHWHRLPRWVYHPVARKLRDNEQVVFAHLLLEHCEDAVVKADEALGIDGTHLRRGAWKYADRIRLHVAHLVAVARAEQEGRQENAHVAVSDDKYRLGGVGGRMAVGRQAPGDDFIFSVTPRPQVLFDIDVAGLFGVVCLEVPFPHVALFGFARRVMRGEAERDLVLIVS
jgi:hypothetical protein